MNSTRILIAEDEGIVAANMELRLQSLGYDVVSIVDSGEQAVQQALTQRPDLVLMDIRLAGTMDGVSAAGLIRKRLDLPVVYLTAYTDDETIERAKQTEPYGYIVKPFDARALHTTIAMALHKHSRHSQIQQRQTVDVQRQKVELLTSVATGLAAEFGDLLTVILGSTSALLFEPPADPSARQFIGLIDTAARRAADLIQQMLAYTGQGRLFVQQTDLNELVREVCGQFSPAPDVELRQQLAPDLPLLIIDAEQIRQVLRALLANAIEAIGDGAGTITVSSERQQLAREFIARTYLAPELPPGDYVALRISDSGVGMDERTQERLFEPFFSTKLPGRGLGLAVALGIVSSHRGVIDVVSAPEQGTTISVLLPVGLQVAPDWQNT
jgi:signal transduction histidine kinase